MAIDGIPRMSSSRPAALVRFGGELERQAGVLGGSPEVRQGFAWLFRSNDGPKPGVSKEQDIKDKYQNYNWTKAPIAKAEGEK